MRKLADYFRRPAPPTARPSPAAPPAGQFVAGKLTRPSWSLTRSPMQHVKRAYGEF